ncbi:hypothetical protein LTR96_011387 [Exophiala xenobiotica]|nr:hypothetical protein LTR72_011862 [Exophiala xenobiotica]KAK5263187.1 hypothetical protein LTR96_011387 [Exophiala xenobiotica]KAK5282778.1 hypothetical protein LTR14_011979 [Exophiala xenobiotica]KAK5332488.1 hypothetical protein LTR98_011394 [Exophiala xenobiotica]KAK5463778.1 hypothetical protein LTR55_011830 [Exophiala xenobiotica]
MPQYHYDNLDYSREEFRILVLKPSKRRHKIIKCDLVTTHTGQDDSQLLATYQAVSYAWGSQEKPYHILLVGIRHSVTKNLGCLLERLRQNSSNVYLWIDALCINQHNDEEKQHQIGLMRKIYGKSPRLIIWLGEDTGKDDSAMHVIERNEMFYSTAIHPVTATKAEMECFSALMHQSWWRRAWVLQEFVLGTRPGQEDRVRIIYGQSELRWPTFRKAMQRLAEFNERGRQRYPFVENALVLESLRLQYYESSPIRECSPLWWLSKTRGRQSTDPRDKLFALQSITNANDDLSRSLIADYSVSPTELFIKFAKHADSEEAVYGTNKFECLEELEEIHTDSAIIFRQIECPLSHYDSSVGAQPHFSVSEDVRNILQCSGLLYDEIENIHKPFVDNVTDPWENATQFMIAIGECKSMQQQYTGASNPYENAAGRLTAFWRTLMADHAGDNQYRPYLGDDYLQWLPSIPESWTPGTVHNVTTRPAIKWRNKFENMMMCHRFAQFLRRRDIQLKEFSWSDFEVKAVNKLPQDILDNITDDLSETHAIQQGLFEDLILKKDDLCPNLLKVAGYQFANMRSPEILFRWGDGESWGQYMLNRWNLQDQMEKITKTWQDGSYDLINSPFRLPSVVPDPYEHERGDPDFEIEISRMEDEVLKHDSSSPERKIKVMPADNAVGYAGEKGREQYALGRSFFVTKKGYFGLAPPDARKKDVIAILFGSKVPLVLRSQADGTFVLIGETHVQGLMDGEAVKKMQAEGASAQTISIV